jgi:hypothetical protein
MGPVVMRMNGAAMPVQIMVIKPLGYRLKIRAGCVSPPRVSGLHDPQLS